MPPNEPDQPALAPAPERASYQPVVGGETQNSPANQNPPSTGPVNARGKNKKRTLLILVAVLVALLGCSAAAYYGYIAPNNPDSIWSNSLKNTSKGYDKLVDYANTTKDVKGIKSKGTLKMEGALAGDGSFESTSYENKGTAKGDIGFAGTRYGFEGRFITPAGAKSPDIYLKVSGIKGLDSYFKNSPYAGIGSGLESLDNKWIAIDHTLLDQYSGSAGQSSYTKDDTIQIAKAVGKVNKDYLFSTDSSKAVLKVSKKIGKETRKGRSSYHFEVGYDKENLKKYVAALRDSLNNTKLKNMFGGQGIEQALNTDEINKSIAAQKGDETADVWVDINTKLIRAVRFKDSKAPGNYLEISLEYNGGDEYPFLVTVNDTSGSYTNGTLGFTINTKQTSAKLDFSLETGKDKSKEKYTASFTIEPNLTPVDVTKPDGAKSVQELLGLLIGGM
ncbi:MAG TPA: hypothetical protein VLG25_00090 [Patescibacteria group bacterium]|nr:hypothetical protein [Patescibacteria group bacterium]